MRARMRLIHSEDNRRFVDIAMTVRLKLAQNCRAFGVYALFFVAQLLQRLAPSGEEILIVCLALLAISAHEDARSANIRSFCSITARAYCLKMTTRFATYKNNLKGNKPLFLWTQLIVCGQTTLQMLRELLISARSGTRCEPRTHSGSLQM